MAAPAHALVQIQTDDDCIYVTVRDDGHGFDPPGQTTGFGLHGMRERAELLGGILNIDSAPGEGTEISASLPTGRTRSQRAS